MSPARPRARALLCLLGGLGPQLLLLLLRPPAAAGDCSLPPDVPNAQATLRHHTSFPEQITVTYKCNKGFVKVPGKADSVVCQNSKWSELAEFCNRSCDVPTRLLFASLKKSYSQQNYFPEGSTVEYECRLGYIRDPSLSGNITCLQNFTWSKPDGFCKKKSCPKPREIEKGHVNITTDILLGATIYFSCNAGYKLVGAASSVCAFVGNTVGWTAEFPECQEILCPEPPKVDHGMIQEKQSSYAYRQPVTYKCMEGFTLHGQSSIYCTIKDDQGEWSGPLPQCRETDVTPTVSKSTEVNVPGTKVLSTPQKPTTVNVSATETPPTPQKPTTVNVPAAETPPTPQKPTTVNVPAAETPPTPQKPTTVNVSAAETPPTPQKPTTVNVPAAETPPTPQKPTTVNVPAAETPPTPQKPTTVNVPAAETPPTPQKPTTVNVPAAETPPTPQKPTTVNVPAAETPPTPQKPTTVNVPAAETPPTPQKPTTVNVPAAETPPTPQKPTTVNVPATETPPTPQKLITINSSATKPPLVSQTYTTVHVPATKVPSPPQKPSTANGSTMTVWNSQKSNTVSTAVQNPIMANASATTPTTQRFTPAKSLLTSNLKATQKSTSVHKTKGLRITQRLTSARVTAAKSTAVPRTTSRFHATGTPKGRGSTPSVASTTASGHMCITLTILLMMLETVG
ncbi:complement decay-accelerating factor isoform X3 [Moschus berezovskii]|uniref:complement decay-accelerating factor isoform X3 n=1 Tax=Moschus berezovskii TaxID=68408 RepID=UPI0024438BCD|nr:complement decay-accelerating factor isoform X3 [Moschus berezovskii]